MIVSRTLRSAHLQQLCWKGLICRSPCLLLRMKCNWASGEVSSMVEINHKYIPGDFLIIRLKLIISYQLWDSLKTTFSPSIRKISVWWANATLWVRCGNNNVWGAVWGKWQLPALLFPIFFFLPNYMELEEWAGRIWMLPSHNKSCHGCHASMKLQETVMCFENRPGIIQACTWLSQVEGKLRECLQS